MTNVSGSVAVLGERALGAGFELVGIQLLAAETAGEVKDRWDHLPADVLIVILTPAAAATLADQLDGARPPTMPMTVVMPV